MEIQIDVTVGTGDYYGREICPGPEEFHRIFGGDSIGGKGNDLIGGQEIFQMPPLHNV